jgi:hypothetical protein
MNTKTLKMNKESPDGVLPKAEVESKGSPHFEKMPISVAMQADNSQSLPLILCSKTFVFPSVL